MVTWIEKELPVPIQLNLLIHRPLHLFSVLTVLMVLIFLSVWHKQHESKMKTEGG